MKNQINKICKEALSLLKVPGISSSNQEKYQFTQRKIDEKIFELSSQDDVINFLERKNHFSAIFFRACAKYFNFIDEIELHISDLNLEKSTFQFKPKEILSEIKNELKIL